MPDAYDYITLMCRLKAAQARNKELESGEHYIKLKELHQKECRVYEHKIQKLESAIADAHKETIRVRNYWFQVLEDMLLEFESMQKKAAQLCFGLVKNHAMLDGNKRLGTHVMFVFLALNGYELIYTQQELVEIILQLAAGKIDAEDLLKWIIEHQK